MCKPAATATLRGTDMCWDVLIKHSTTLKGLKSKSVTIYSICQAKQVPPPVPLHRGVSEPLPPSRPPFTSLLPGRAGWVISHFWMWLPDHSVTLSGFPVPVIFPDLVGSFYSVQFRQWRVEWRKNLFLPTDEVAFLSKTAFPFEVAAPNWPFLSRKKKHALRCAHTITAIYEQFTA